MSSITIDEAARYLGVTTRTISTYISQGLLSYHKKQGSNKKYITVSDVHDFKVAKENDEFSIKKFRELSAKVKRLEAEMEVIMRILDTKEIPLGITDDSAKELYNTALQCTSSNFSLELVEAWLPVFMSLSEYDLEKIQEVEKVSNPWQPFVDTCINLIVGLTSTKEYETSLELQLLHKSLSEARRRLRLSALLFIERKGPVMQVDNLYISSPDTTVETLKKFFKK